MVVEELEPVEGDYSDVVSALPAETPRQHWNGGGGWRMYFYFEGQNCTIERVCMIDKTGNGVRFWTGNDAGTLEVKCLKN